MFYSIFIFLFILIILILLIFLIFTQIKNKKYPYCGGYLNMKDIPKCKANDCADINNDFAMNLAIVIELLLEIYINTPNTFLNQIKQLYPLAKVYKGIFYFAPFELLKILPSDFGQNKSTPYGIISFFYNYISCISDIQEFCSLNLKNNPKLISFCNSLQLIKEKNECPFLINDNNPDLYISDKKFFNNIGLLGTFSLNFQQAILLKIKLPIKDLNLNYWSLNLYLADNLDPNLICHPYLNLNVASLVPPLNMFTSVGISRKKFNPLTGEGELLENGFLNFLVIICLNQNIGNELKTKFQTQYDFIHIFGIPTLNGSMTIDSNLPNPNNLITNSALFNPNNQRLTMFMRLSPDPTQNDQTFFNSFIKDKSGQYFQTLLISFNDNNYSIVKYPKINYPLMINSTTNEYNNINSFKNIIKNIRNNLFLTYRIKKLQLRNSTLNIFGPKFKNVINTLQSYKGGWQSIQLAGNAQGDNYDAQYRLSESVCLQKKDVMFCVCVNHSYYDNSLYNSINLVDLNKGSGIVAFNLNNNYKDDYYIVLFGRDMESINIFENKLKLNNIKIFKYYIDTNEIPLCHHLLMVERTYLNINYLSIDRKNIYSLYNLFGNNFKQFNKNQKDDEWNSLINVVAPNLDYLIPPNYYIISPISNITYFIVGIIITFLILLLTIMFHYKFKI